MTGDPETLATRRSRLLELRVGLLKSRARAKQLRLEKMLSSPAEGRPEILRRKQWISEALEQIRQAQAGLTYRAGLLDAYTEHLHVLEMTLMAAAEKKQAPSP